MAPDCHSWQIVSTPKFSKCAMIEQHNYKITKNLKQGEGGFDSQIHGPNLVHSNRKSSCRSRQILNCLSLRTNKENQSGTGEDHISIIRHSQIRQSNTSCSLSLPVDWLKQLLSYCWGETNVKVWILIIDLNGDIIWHIIAQWAAKVRREPNTNIWQTAPLRAAAGHVTSIKKQARKSSEGAEAG